jgi:hypothetical protein
MQIKHKNAEKARKMNLAIALTLAFFVLITYILTFVLASMLGK